MPNTHQKCAQFLAQIIYHMGLPALLLLGSTTPLLAQPAEPSGDRDSPSRTVGGGSRDGGSHPFPDILYCGDSEPENSDNISTVFAPLVSYTHGEGEEEESYQKYTIYTQSERPNIYIHIPKNTKNRALFELHDSEGNSIFFSGLFDLEQSGVITRLILPETISLSVPDVAGAWYEWFLYISCHSEDPERPTSIEISGYIDWLATPEPEHSALRFQNTIEGLWGEPERPVCVEQNDTSSPVNDDLSQIPEEYQSVGRCDIYDHLLEHSE
ncbi:MAG: DUF928 domain-containing protein [Spirulina sp. SIO3F2]|nr:DUF928 domain-containing protein [Spirulina sp. SIO3F2]